MRESAKASARQILTDYLETKRHRKTPERFAILDAVYSINGHFTLDELEKKLTEEQHFIVSRATLYNTLKLFMEVHLVVRHRFKEATKYEACFSCGNHCHQMCLVCGKVAEIKSPELDSVINGVRLKRFRKDGYVLYIHGVCSACQTKIAREKAKAKKAAAKVKENKSQKKKI